MTRAASWRRSEAGPALPRAGATAAVLGWGTLAVLSFVALALLFERLDSWQVMAGLLVFLAGALCLVRPNAATVLTVFLLYVNFPAILTKQHSVPSVAAGAFILLLGFPLLHLLFVRREPLRADRTFAMMFAFLAVLLVSSLGAVDKKMALSQVFQYALEGMLLYWLVINVVRSGAVLRRSIWTLLAAGSLVSGLCLYQELSGSYEQEFGGLAYRHYVDDPDVERDGPLKRKVWDRAQGPLDEPNRFAQVLIVLVPLAVFSHRSGRRRRDRFLAAAAGLLILGGIGLTLSRGATLVLVMMALLMAALRWVRPAHLAACFLALMIAIPIMSPHFVPRMMRIINAKHLLADDPSALGNVDGAILGRTTSMLTALNVFRDHPLLGVGPGQFRFYYVEYSDNPSIQFRDHGGGTRRAHSLYFEMAAESGVAGLTIFLGMVLLLVNGLWRARRRLGKADPEASDLATAFGLSLFGYMGTALFLHLSYQRYFWLLLALASAALHVAMSRGATAADPEAAESRGGALDRSYGGAHV